MHMSTLMCCTITTVTVQGL